MIPSTIHQIWWQGCSRIPSKYKRNCSSWQALNPDMTYVCWDERQVLDLLNEATPDLVPILQAYPYMVQKIDIAKYVILYIFGGVYVDMDMEPKKPLATLLHRFNTKGFIVAHHNTQRGMIFLSKLIGLKSDYLINNAMIATEKGHPIMHDILTNCLRSSKRMAFWNNFLPRVMSISLTTGPTAFTNVVVRNSKNPSLIILPGHYFEPCDIFQSCTRDTGNVFAVHGLDASWAGGEKQFVVFLSRNWLVMALIIIFLVCAHKGK